MLELRVATANPWVAVVLDGRDDFLLDDQVRIVSELPISAALH
jgi:hypothetical protein